MTWTATAIVQDVSDGPAPIDVLASCYASDSYTTHLADGSTQEYPAIISNTEGKIRSVELKLQLDEDATALKPGDLIRISGHFAGVDPNG